MRPVFTILLAAAVAASVAFGMVKTFGVEPTQPHENAAARVMRTGTLRCAYWSLQPLSYKDVKTGELKGYAIDLFQELSRRLSLKVEWVEEVNFATMMAGLEADRYDAICTGVWLSANRSRVMEYTWPYMFSTVIPVVRYDDHRFDADLNSMNDEKVRFAVQDNLSVSLTAEKFPKAKKLQLPEMAPITQVFLDVESGKADVALTDASDFQHYAGQNPGKLRIVHADKPLRLYPWVIPVRKGEHELASLINGALSELVYNGDIERITRRNGIPTGAYGYYRPSVEFSGKQPSPTPAP